MAPGAAAPPSVAGLLACRRLATALLPSCCCWLPRWLRGVAAALLAGLLATALRCGRCAGVGARVLLLPPRPPRAARSSRPMARTITEALAPSSARPFGGMLLEVGKAYTGFFAPMEPATR